MGCRHGDDNDRFLKEVRSINIAVSNARNEHQAVFSVPPYIYIITKALYYQRLFEIFLSLGGCWYWGAGRQGAGRFDHDQVPG